MCSFRQAYHLASKAKGTFSMSFPRSMRPFMSTTVAEYRFFRIVMSTVFSAVLHTILRPNVLQNESK